MFEKMTMDELIARRAAIAQEVDTEGADLDALEKEARDINAEIEKRKAAEAKRREIRSAVAAGAGEVVETTSTRETRTERTEKEIRSSREYVDAFATYIKTGDDKECRALLTTNATTGTVPVPVIVEERVRAAWERNGLLDLVRKTYVRGNLRVGFEVSATGAVVHEEGAEAPAEEVLTLGVVELIPKSIKKFIRVSDEALDLSSASSEEFLNYVYDEITYQIAKAAKAQLIATITGAPATTTASAVGVPKITGAPGLAIVAQAIANLSEDAENVAVVMNRLTHAAFMEAITAANFMFDPFDGVAVHYSSDLPAYAAASSGAVWMIAGDFAGATMNFPNGEEIKLKFDDLSEAESDLVKIVGRMFVAIGITNPGHFVNVAKA